MIINHNISALSTLNRLNKNNKNTANAMEKLSSGLRINIASDDSAGLAISEKMRAQIRGLQQAQRNTQDGISLIQTAEGGLGDITNQLQRARELSVQSANDTLTNKDRQQIQKEVEQIKKGINTIANHTEFNTHKLLNGSVSYSSLPPTPQSTFASTSGGSGKTVSDGWVNVGTNGARVKLNPGEQVVDDPDNWFFTELSLSADIVSGVAVGLDLYNTDGLVVVHNHPDTTFEYNGMTFDVSNYLGATGTGSQHQGNIVLTAGNNDGAINNDVDGRKKLQIGANSGNAFTIDIADVRTNSLGISNISVETSSQSQTAIEVIDNALETVSSERGKLGAYQNRLEHSLNNLSNYELNLTSAESRIRDADMAKQMMALTKNQILSQASQAMLTQASQQPQHILELLR